MASDRWGGKQGGASCGTEKAIAAKHGEKTIRTEKATRKAGSSRKLEYDGKSNIQSAI